MDFIEGLPKSAGYNSILVVVDRFTKYAHFIPMKHPFTARSVASSVLNHVVKHHGLPTSIVFDRDRIFTSSFWKELFKILDTKLLMSTAYHPQKDGQYERVNQCLEMYLRCSIHNSPTKWSQWLPLAELWYNSSFHTSLGCSPFKVIYGYEPRIGAFPLLPSDPQQTMDERLTERDHHLDLIKRNLVSAQLRVKQQVDKNRTDRQFKEGEQVLLKLQPYAQSSVAKRPYPKLAFKYFGPYKVLQKIGSAAYKLELPTDSLVHAVFHVSQLKPFSADYIPVYKDLNKLIDLSTVELLSETVLQRRLVKKGNHAITQVLVKWCNLPADYATWEDWNVVTKKFPRVVAWGQANSSGTGDVTPAMAETSVTETSG